jgi:pimeloyl-ACP methyl ester carboxylesterase
MYDRAKAHKVVEVPNASHVVMISNPKAVAALIDEAARATS